MNKIEQTATITLNFNTIQLPELGSLKRTKSDRIQLPSEPSKKIKNYFNSYNNNYCLDNLDSNNNNANNNNNNNTTTNSSISDSSLDLSAENHDDSEQRSNDFFSHYQVEEQQQQNCLDALDEEQIQTNEQQQPIKLKSDIYFSSEGHCTNYEDRSYRNIFSEDNQNVSMIVGYVCIAFAAVLFTSTLFSIFFAPFLQPTTHNLIEFLRTDNYYCFLIPLSLPVLIITIYMNWVSMKYFKHS